MNNNFLLDTNILIYYFNGIIDDEYIDTFLKESFNISIITKIEFLGWQKLNLDTKLKEKALVFIEHATVYELTDEIANKVIDLRQ
jgi:predicted nucleic acid-binding protein